jgi:hypothetical protein
VTPAAGQTAELVARLRAAGVTLEARGDRLAWSAPPGVMTPALLDDLRAEKAAVLAALRAESDGWIPLAAVQERLYVVERLWPGRPDLNVPAAVRVRGDIDLAALGAALDELAARHEALRMAFAAAGERPLQRVAASVRVPFELREVDGERAALAAAVEEARRPFDLSVAPLLRALGLRVGPDDWLLVITLHHLVCDEASLRIALRELITLYASRALGRTTGLRRPARQYSGYVAESAADSSDGWGSDLAFWRQTLAGLPGRPARGPAGGAHAASLDVPRAAVAELSELARTERSTLVCVIFAAFAVALAPDLRRDIVIGLPVDDRRDPAYDGTVGTFVNTIAVRVPTDGASAFRSVVRETRGALAAALAHARVPYHRVVAAVRPDRGGELFDAWLVVRRGLPALSLDGVSLSRVDLEQAVPRHELKLDLEQREDGLAGALMGRVPAWEPPAVDRLAAHTAAALTLAGKMADAPLAEFISGTEASAAQRLRSARERADESARARLRTARRTSVQP